MKLSTMTVNTLELTRAEHNHLWENWYEEGFDRQICGLKGVKWFDQDGENSIFFEGETHARQIIITD